MKAWQRAWRYGIGPNLSIPGLKALRQALVADDPALMQGGPTVPDAPRPRRDHTGAIYKPAGRRATACCAIAFAAWKGDGLRRVSELEDYFEGVTLFADLAFREAGQKGRSPVMTFIVWFDWAPRKQMRAALLAEVERSLAERQEPMPAVPVTSSRKLVRARGRRPVMCLPPER